MLVCTCTHNRKDHEAGLENLNDRAVHKCKVQNCTCTKYHPDKESRNKKYKTEIALRGVIIAFIGLLIIISGGFFIQSIFEHYDVIPIKQIEVYEDGELKESEYTPKEAIVQLLQTFYSMLIGIIFLYWGMEYLTELYNQAKRLEMQK